MNHPTRRRSRHTRGNRAAALVAAAGLTVLPLLTACGSSTASPDAEDAGSAATPADFPVTVASGRAAAGEEVTVKEEPTSIVSLSPTATEMLWAVGAADQVVAVDDQSNYPKDVPTTELSGYEPNVEAILSYEPDLVVAAEDSGDLVSSLEATGVPTLLLPSATDLAESYDQIERLGRATGNVTGATEVVDEMRTGIEEAVADAPDADGMTYFHELTPDLYTATGDTFIGEVYGLFGLQSIADAEKSGDDYPQLSAEYVVSADPDFVFLADTDCCGVKVSDIGKRAGWDQVTAVEEGQVLEVDKDIASRWGPRVVDFVEAVARILGKAEAAAPAA